MPGCRWVRNNGHTDYTSDCLIVYSAYCVAFHGEFNVIATILTDYNM